MKYDFKCKNEKCSEYNKVKEYNIPLSDYKIPDCDNCGQEMQRVYNTFGVKTSDGVKVAK